MDVIEKYLRENSIGRAKPICSRKLAAVFGVPTTTIRHMIKKERTCGSPIASCQSGYYLASDREDIVGTIQSLRGHIHKMESAIAGLESYLN